MTENDRRWTLSWTFEDEGDTASGYSFDLLLKIIARYEKRGFTIHWGCWE